MESADDDTHSSHVLDDSVLNEITNALPTISTAVPERVRKSNIQSENAAAEITVCGTSPQYMRLLQDVARVEIQKGRFIELTDEKENARVVVLSEELANKLFLDADPVGQSVVLQDQKLTVVGVVSDGAQWGANISRDAYVPLNLSEPGTNQNEPVRYDRFRFQVKSIDQLENSRAIILNIIERRLPSQNIRVR